MSPTPRSVDTDKHLKAGVQCFVTLLDQRYLSTVLSVKGEIVRVTFPMREFPVPGMRVMLEFHDDLGFTSYECEVHEPPNEPGDGLQLKAPVGGARSHHRSFWRVPVRLEATIKHQVHPRKHECVVLDLSAGGVLVQTGAELTAGDVAELSFVLPGAGTAELTCKVVHMPTVSAGTGKLHGCEFVGPDPVLLRAITTYVRQRLRELDPES